MKLTSLFRREYLLIAVATCAGMGAQEVVSRISSASDRPAERSTVVAVRNWESTEAFYYSDPHAQSLFRSEIAPQPTLDTPPAVAELPVPTSQQLALADGPSLSLVAQAQDVDPPFWQPAESTQAGETRVKTADDLPGAADTGVAALTEVPRIAAAIDPPQPASPGPANPPAVAVDVLPTPVDAPEMAWGPVGEMPSGIANDPVHSPVDLPRPAVLGAAVSAASTPPLPEQRHYLGPEQLVRERSIQRAELRRQRLEAFRQMGYSPLRPTVSANPYFSGGSPRPLVVLVPVVVERESSTVR